MNSSASNTALMEDTDEIVLNFGDEGLGRKPLKHPVAVFFHLVFRILALVVYIFCGWFSNSFIASFVCIVLLLSLDFWTVKNVTGRLLVGLRWWNHVDDDGQSQWIYESRKTEDQGMINSSEARVFWLGVVICPVLWTVFMLIAIFGLKFKWVIVTLVGVVLNGANLHGYLKCKIGNRQHLKDIASNFMGRQLVKNMLDTFKNKPTVQESAGESFRGVV